jgi:hypothetical protein
MFTTIKIDPIGDPTPDGDCNLTLGSTGCNVTFTMHFNLTIDFYVCLDASMATQVTADTCPEYATTFVGSQTSERSAQFTQYISTWDITKALDSALLASLWDGFKADFVNCSKGSLSGCAWAATWFVPPSKVVDALRLLAAFNDALRSGVGIADAVDAIRAAKTLDPQVLAEIQGDADVVEAAFEACDLNSFPGSTRVLLADGSYRAIGSVRIGDRLLATDPATGASQAEPVTAAFTHETRQLVDVVLDGGGQLTTTEGHRIFVVKRGWTLASELRLGDLTQAADGSTHAIIGLSVRAGLAPRTVFDVTVANLHTFYVRTVGTHPPGPAGPQLHQPGHGRSGVPGRRPHPQRTRQRDCAKGCRAGRDEAVSPQRSVRRRPTRPAGGGLRAYQLSPDERQSEALQRVAAESWHQECPLHYQGPVRRKEFPGYDISRR